jgi:hypothetical protein
MRVSRSTPNQRFCAELLGPVTGATGTRLVRQGHGGRHEKLPLALKLHVVLRLLGTGSIRGAAGQVPAGETSRGSIKWKRVLEERARVALLLFELRLDALWLALPPSAIWMGDMPDGHHCAARIAQSSLRSLRGRLH